MSISARASDRCRPSIVLAGIGDEASMSLEGQIAAQLEVGWSSIELRRIDGRWIHQLGADSIQDIARRLRTNGLGVCALASPIGNWASSIECPLHDELAEFERVLRAAVLLGAPLVRVMSYPKASLPHARWRTQVIGRMRAFAERAQEVGVIVGIENCSGYAATDAEYALDLLTAVSVSSLRLVFDTGNAIAYGYDGMAYLERVIAAVAHVHIKDGVALTGGSALFTMPGRGEARLHSALRLLLDEGYRGCLSIEPEIAQIVHLDQGTPDSNRRAVYSEYALQFEHLLRALLPEAVLRDGTITMPEPA